MPVPKKYLDAILDSVEKSLDEFKKRMDSGECGDLESFVAQLKPEKPLPFQANSPPEQIHKSKDLF